MAPSQNFSTPRERDVRRATAAAWFGIIESIIWTVISTTFIFLYWTYQEPPGEATSFRRAFHDSYFKTGTFGPLLILVTMLITLVLSITWFISSLYLFHVLRNRLQYKPTLVVWSIITIMVCVLDLFGTIIVVSEVVPVKEGSKIWVISMMVLIISKFVILWFINVVLSIYTMGIVCEGDDESRWSKLSVNLNKIKKNTGKLFGCFGDDDWEGGSGEVSLDELPKTRLSGGCATNERSLTRWFGGLIDLLRRRVRVEGLGRPQIPISNSCLELTKKKMVQDRKNQSTQDISRKKYTLERTTRTRRTRKEVEVKRSTSVPTTSFTKLVVPQNNDWVEVDIPDWEDTSLDLNQEMILFPRPALNTTNFRENWTTHAFTQTVNIPRNSSKSCQTVEGETRLSPILKPASESCQKRSHVTFAPDTNIPDDYYERPSMTYMVHHSGDQAILLPNLLPQKTFQPLLIRTISTEGFYAQQYVMEDFPEDPMYKVLSGLSWEAFSSQVFERPSKIISLPDFQKLAPGIDSNKVDFSSPPPVSTQTDAKTTQYHARSRSMARSSNLSRNYRRDDDPVVQVIERKSTGTNIDEDDEEEEFTIRRKSRPTESSSESAVTDEIIITMSPDNRTTKISYLTLPEEEEANRGFPGKRVTIYSNENKLKTVGTSNSSSSDDGYRLDAVGRGTQCSRPNCRDSSTQDQKRKKSTGVSTQDDMKSYKKEKRYVVHYDEEEADDAGMKTERRKIVKYARKRNLREAGGSCQSLEEEEEELWAPRLRDRQVGTGWRRTERRSSHVGTQASRDDIGQATCCTQTFLGRDDPRRPRTSYESREWLGNPPGRSRDHRRDFLGDRFREPPRKKQPVSFSRLNSANQTPTSLVTHATQATQRSVTPEPRPLRAGQSMEADLVEKKRCNHQTMTREFWNSGFKVSTSSISLPESIFSSMKEMEVVQKPESKKDKKKSSIPIPIRKPKSSKVEKISMTLERYLESRPMDTSKDDIKDDSPDDSKRSTLSSSIGVAVVSIPPGETKPACPYCNGDQPKKGSDVSSVIQNARDFLSRHDCRKWFRGEERSEEARRARIFHTKQEYRKWLLEEAAKEDIPKNDSAIRSAREFLTRQYKRSKDDELRLDDSQSFRKPVSAPDPAREGYSSADEQDDYPRIRSRFMRNPDLEALRRQLEEENFRRERREASRRTFSPERYARGSKSQDNKGYSVKSKRSAAEMSPIDDPELVTTQVYTRSRWKGEDMNIQDDCYPSRITRSPRRSSYLSVPESPNDPTGSLPNSRLSSKRGIHLKRDFSSGSFFAESMEEIIEYPNEPRGSRICRIRRCRTVKKEGGNVNDVTEVDKEK